MGDESADSEVENLEEQFMGDAPIEEAESEEYHTVSEGIAIEVITLAAHDNAQTPKLLLIQ